MGDLHSEYQASNLTGIDGLAALQGEYDFISMPPRQEDLLVALKIPSKVYLCLCAMHLSSADSTICQCSCLCYNTI